MKSVLRFICFPAIASHRVQCYPHNGARRRLMPLAMWCTAAHPKTLSTLSIRPHHIKADSPASGACQTWSTQPLPVTAAVMQRQRMVHTRAVRGHGAVQDPSDDENQQKPAAGASETLTESTAREKQAKAQRRATNSAAGMVSRRPHSELELRAKLAEREHDSDAIDAAVQRLQELGMHSNREYAELFAQSKWRQSRWAPSRMRRELMSKGLSTEDVNHGLRQVFGEDMRISIVPAEDDDEDTTITTDTRFDPQHHLLESARRQAHLSRGLPLQTRRRRLIAYMQRRGHTWDTISALLERVELC